MLQLQGTSNGVSNTKSADQDGKTAQQTGHHDLDEDFSPTGAPKCKIKPLVISDYEDEVPSNSAPSTVRRTPAQDIMREKIY